MKVLFVVVQPNISNDYSKLNVIAYIYDTDIELDLVTTRPSLFSDYHNLTTLTNEKEINTITLVTNFRRDSNDQYYTFCDTC